MCDQNPQYTLNFTICQKVPCVLVQLNSLLPIPSQNPTVLTFFYRLVWPSKCHRKYSGDMIVPLFGIMFLRLNYYVLAPQQSYVPLHEYTVMFFVLFPIGRYVGFTFFFFFFYSP